MSPTKSLSEAVESIEEKTEWKETAENIEEKVATAQGTATQLNNQLSGLADAVEDLQFYRQLLVEMFDHDVPTEVHTSLEGAESAIEADKSTVVQGLVDDPSGNSGSIPQLKSDISGATSTVQSATESVKELLREHRRSWEERLQSARELQRIIGRQNDEFTRTVGWLEQIVSEKMWNTDLAASTVIQEWENATAQWSDHQDLQGLEAFKESHNLSDDTIDAVGSLSSRDNLTLAEVDIEVLEELKEIDQLADAVQLSI